MRTVAAAFATSIVIGSNRGIGLELCKQLHARGDRVVGVCRKASDELKGLGLWKVVEGVDVAKEEEVRSLAALDLGGGVVDNLWLNAGIGDGIEDSLENLDYAQIERSFQVNAMGPLRCVQTMLPCLKKGSKVSGLCKKEEAGLEVLMTISHPFLYIYLDSPCNLENGLGGR
jgi:NAD(P)-dependent dehydrogenase (short-subunit alcohol dehydrogenase family)